MSHWTADHTRRALTLAAKGKTQKQIANALDFPISTVYYHLKRNTPGKRTRLPDDEIAHLRQLVNDGRGTKVIASILRRSQHTIGPYVREYKQSKGEPVKAQPAVIIVAPEPEAPAFKPVIAGPRTIVNAAMRGTLTGGDWIPARIGAMDYAAIKSRWF